MSISIVNPAPNVNPFGTFERANGYNSGVAIVWDSGKREFNPGYVRLYASGTDFTLVDKWGDDIAPNATFTQITAPSSGTLSAVYDKDEGTYARWTVVNSTKDLFSFDLGAQKTVFVNVVVSSNGGSAITFYVYGSNDNTTWTQIGSLNIATTDQTYTLLVYGNYRYFKVSVNSSSTNNYVDNVYEVEVWPAGNTLKSYSITTTTELLALVNNASYQVLEVVYPGANANISTQLTKKQFFWNVKDARTVERGIGGYYNSDTTAVSTTSTSSTTLKTYTFTASAMTNMIRVRVYAYVSGATNGSTITLSIDGTNVASATVKATSSTLYIDYTGSITSGTSHTINVNGTAESGYTLYVSSVYIIAGFGLTSTTSTQILTITLNTASTDSYVLYSTGNFVYKMGIRWWITGNRLTSTAASFSSTLANEIQGGYTPSANDDGNNNAFITIRTGDYPGDNASFTISGNVGASGDVIIITGIYAQVVLRGYNTDSLNAYSYWLLLVREKGVVNWTQELLSIDGGSYSNIIDLIVKNAFKQLYSSSAGTNVISYLTFPSNDSPEIALHINYNDDIQGRVYCFYINVIVI